MRKVLLAHHRGKSCKTACPSRWHIHGKYIFTAIAPSRRMYLHLRRSEHESCPVQDVQTKCAECSRPNSAHAQKSQPSPPAACVNTRQHAPGYATVCAVGSAGVFDGKSHASPSPSSAATSTCRQTTWQPEKNPVLHLSQPARRKSWLNPCASTNGYGAHGFSKPAALP